MKNLKIAVAILALINITLYAIGLSGNRDFNAIFFGNVLIILFGIPLISSALALLFQLFFDRNESFKKRYFNAFFIISFIILLVGFIEALYKTMFDKF